MSGIYTKIVEEMLERMTDEEKEKACKALMDALGIERKLPKMDKHCPMCGGDLVIEETLDERTHIVRCEKCGISGMAGIREDNEDLPTKATLEYGKKLQDAMEAFMKTYVDVCTFCCGEDETEDDDEDVDDDDAYCKPDYHYTPKKKCNHKEKNEKEAIISLLKSIIDKIDE